ncbi:PREDICTED: uncharacterized protein LOC105448758 isoform X1 [Wasmannia auropunctata]|uniref:uncharacterized protein LOC105448758 isoform X1 n=1 Tax=Wasmannia auropunctata TaxID=64793 RepID=UPI0005EED0BE|nr:PREDICTED: uncharacterized protein LOC105448758 isoform X1 [Wasmannia auropunctata]
MMKIYHKRKILELLHELLGTKPFMSPVATTSSTGKRTASESCFDLTDDDVKKEPQNKKKQRTYSAEHLLTELKENRDLTEVATERRHRENMDMRERLLKSFEDMVKALTNK